jgi:hypothetical protein
VHGIAYEDDVITVDGTLDGKPWTYALNTMTGDEKLRIGDTVSP